MNAIPARAMGPPTASTSWLPAGPTTATMLEFEMNCWVTVVACAGCSCVSPGTIVSLVLLAALSASRASCAKCSCSVPRTATGPVIGPSNPIDAVHDLVLAPVPPVDPPLAALLLLLLLQPATASEPTAAMARTRRPFIGYASIPGLCHEVDVEVEVGVLPRHAARTGGTPPDRPSAGSCAGAPRPRRLNMPSPMAEFVTLIKPSRFVPRQEDEGGIGLAVVKSLSMGRR